MQGNGAVNGNLKTAETKGAAAAPEAKGILVADQPEAIQPVLLLLPAAV